MLWVLPGAARFYSRPSDRCGTFKGPSFPLPRPALFFPVWCWGARQGPQVRSSQHNASKTCRDTHFFLSLLFVGCSPSVWPLVSSFFFCFFLLQIIFLASAFAGCSREGRVSCVVFFFSFMYTHFGFLSVSRRRRALSPLSLLSGLRRLLLRNRVLRFLPDARKARAAARTGPLSATTIA